MRNQKTFFTQAYSSVRFKSKRMGRKLPEFSKQDLIDWLNENGFQNLWAEYEKVGYEKDIRPSIDRVDDYKGYSFDNMQLITWKENQIKGVNGVKHHKNCHNRQNRKSVNLFKDGKFIKSFDSLIDCADFLGCHKVSVSRCLTGRRKSILKHNVEYASSIRDKQLSEVKV